MSDSATSHDFAVPRRPSQSSHSRDNHDPQAERQSLPSDGRRASKRRRDESSGRSSSSAGVSSFTESTRFTVHRSLSHGKCWHCEAPSTRLDICHVIPKHENDEFVAMQTTLGDMALEHLHHRDNSISLCQTCHTSLDSKNMGFVFLPSDLQFFINYEINDYQERLHHLESNGHPRPRRCPSAQDYASHQNINSTGEAGADTPGGYYHRYLLRDFLMPVDPPRAWVPGKWPDTYTQGKRKQWWGAPMAAIWNASRALGALTCLLPPTEVSQLRELQTLLSRKLPSIPPPQAARDPTDPLSTNLPLQEGSDPPLPHVLQNIPTLSAPSAAPYTPPHQQHQPSTHPLDDNAHHCAHLALSDSAVDVRSIMHPDRSVVPLHNQVKAMKRKYCDDNARWRWGPSSSSSDKILSRRKRVKVEPAEAFEAHLQFGLSFASSA